MAKKIKAQFSNNLVTSILMIVLGVLFCILQGGVIGVAMTVLGVALIVLAVMDLLKKRLAQFLIKLLLGIGVILFGWLLASIAWYVLAVLLVLYGVMEFVECLKKKTNGLVSLLLTFAKPVLCIVVGVCMFIGQAGWIFWAVGIVLIVDGVLGLLSK